MHVYWTYPLYIYGLVFQLTNIWCRRTVIYIPSLPTLSVHTCIYDYSVGRPYYRPGIFVRNLLLSCFRSPWSGISASLCEYQWEMTCENLWKMFDFPITTGEDPSPSSTAFLPYALYCPHHSLPCSLGAFYLCIYLFGGLMAVLSKVTYKLLLTSGLWARQIRVKSLTQGLNRPGFEVITFHRGLS